MQKGDIFDSTTKEEDRECAWADRYLGGKHYAGMAIESRLDFWCEERCPKAMPENISTGKANTNKIKESQVHVLSIRREMEDETVERRCRQNSPMF